MNDLSPKDSNDLAMEAAANAGQGSIQKGAALQDPAVLRSQSGLKAFLRWTTAWLERSLPAGMATVAHDAAVDTALKVIEEPERFPSIAHAYGYARTTAVRMAARERKRSHRECAHEDVAMLATLESFETHSQQAAELECALATLPEHLRRTVVALKLEGLSVRKFAEREGIAESTAMNRMSAALKLLRKSLTGAGA